MSTIKFRAWTNAESHMYYDVGISPHAEDYHVFDEKGAIYDMYGSMPTIMQFTGLHDRNGKEIYEGDILENASGFRQVVVSLNDSDYVLGGFVLQDIYDAQTGNSSKRFTGKGWLRDAKVIGNVHENPELLKLECAGIANAKIVGAVGDGIADDTVAVQAAIDRAYK